MTITSPLTPVSSDGFRRALGSFATGVTVITTLAGDRPAGFTCQAFSTVSLSPPLVLFCVSDTSETWPAIRATGRFCVNVLSAGQVGLGGAFARRREERFEEVRWRASPGGMPMLEEAVAWIDCTLREHRPAGDHHIVLGAVHHVGTDPGRDPLLYFRGTLGYAGLP
ncbi:MAG: flavin reductase family protein [Nonomuraea sp.]|nr:flavin reductase family protein [Nonomuraea sp.]